MTYSVKRSTETILVTGACGLIGSHLCAKFLDCGYTVLAYDNNESELAQLALKLKPKGGQKFSYLCSSVSDREAIFSAVEQADVVFHLAAISDLVACEKDPYGCIEVNLIGSMHVIDASILLRKKKLFLASSKHVFNSAGGHYSFAKKALEAYCFNRFADFEKMDSHFSILRIGSIYGFSLVSTNKGDYLSQILKSLYLFKAAEIDPNVSRPYLYVQNLAERLSRDWRNFTHPLYMLEGNSNLLVLDIFDNFVNLLDLDEKEIDLKIKAKPLRGANPFCKNSWDIEGYNAHLMKICQTDHSFCFQAMVAQLYAKKI